jgi:hypothetical protein
VGRVAGSHDSIGCSSSASAAACKGATAAARDWSQRVCVCVCVCVCGLHMMPLVLGAWEGVFVLPGCVRGGVRATRGL